jgi:hypothetical protein
VHFQLADSTINKISIENNKRMSVQSVECFEVTFVIYFNVMIYYSIVVINMLSHSCIVH